MPDIRVTVPGRGVITFAEGTSDDEIQQTIDKEFPLTGGEINQFVAEDPGYARKMSLSDYEELRRYKNENGVGVEAVGQALRKIGDDLSSATSAVANNVTSPLKIVTALGRGALVGTADLGDMIDKIITFDQAPNTYNLYRAKTNQPDNADTRKKYEELLAKDFSAFQESQDYQAARAKVVKESDIPEVTEMSANFLDPSMAIPGAGAGKIGTIADKAIGAAVRTAGKATRFATRPVVDAVEGVAKAAAEAAGPAAKGAAAATGVTGVVMGVPGVREAAGAYAGLKTVDKAAQVAERVGESLMGQPSRVGPLEAMGRVPNASAVDRAIGAVGRRGGDAAIDIINATAGGALTGAAIGGALGFAAEGEEGLYGGIGSGLALGGLGAGLGRTYEKVRGRVVAEARAADLARFTEALDEPTRDLFKKVVERDGPDQAVMVMDGAALLRSQFDDAKVTFLPDTDFKERFGASARGVQLETAGRPEIVINVDKPVSAYTFGHELFHAFDSVEQLKPKSEAIKQEIVGTFLQQPDGTFTQVKAGLLSPDEVDVAFKQYQRKLAQSGAATREWFSAQTPVEKAKLVGKELASEYMARMVTGGDVDGLLRGYDGVTRTLLDQTLMKQSEGVLRGVAERLGLGSAPVESMLFRNLKDASPTLNAMLRDVIRARRNLSERMVLAEDNGVIITPRDISKPIVAEKAVQMGVAERRADGTVAMKPDSVLASEEAAQSQAIKTAVETAPVADPTKPHLRVVDGEVRGAGISPEQAAAIAKAPGISNKLKESLGVVSQSLAAQATPGAPNGLWVEYGAATRRVKNRLTGSYTSKYSSGIRLSQREVVPYELYVSKAGNPVAKAVDVSKLRTVAADLASNGRLGPYERDIAGFLSDSVRYFDNISDPNGVRTRELPGMTEPKATFLNQYFGQQEKGGARFIRDLRLDRITEIRPTGERIAASELAWQRQKVNWMPAEKMPEGEVTSSKQGYRIISRNGKHSLYGADGQRVGIYDTQAAAERKANFMPMTPEEFLKASVGDAAENLRLKLAKREGTGVAKNKFTQFEDKQGRPIGVGAKEEFGGKPFDVWKSETEKWLSDSEIGTFRHWYNELHDNFVAIFGEKRAPTMMMAWLAAQQNVSPGGALGNVFKVEDRLAGIGTGKKGGLADEKIQGVLTQTVPEKGFGAKLTDFVDAGFLKNLRTYMNSDPRGGQPFVADVHTGRDSGHVDHQTLSRLVEKASEGDLFIDGKPVTIGVTQTKTIRNGEKVSKVPTRVWVKGEGIKPFGLEIDMTASPGGTQYEGISEWGNRLTKHLNESNWKGGNWNPAEVQAVGWMRVLRQYGLPEPTVSSALAQNTSRLYAEVNYSSGSALPRNLPEFGKLPHEVQRAITKDVMEQVVPLVANTIGGSLRVRDISIGDGVFGGQKAPSVAIELLGSAESVDLFALTLAHASEQAATMSAVFGTGGKDSRSLRFKKADGSKFSEPEIASLVKDAQLGGFSVHQLPDGTEALITDARSDYTPKAFTEKKAQALFDRLTTWADSQNVALDVKAPPTKVTSYANDWSRHQEGQAYLDLLNQRGGGSRVREVAGLREKYRAILEQAFDQHAPGARSVQGEVGQRNFMPEVSGVRAISLQPEAMPNGMVYRSNVGYTVVNKDGGKFRIYSPLGILVAVANTLEESQRMIERKAK